MARLQSILRAIRSHLPSDSMASSSKGSKQDKTKASTKAHGRVTLEADLRDETLPDSAWYERFKTDFCFGDSNHELLKQKPLPIRWAKYYVDNIKYDEEQGQTQGCRWVDEAIKIMGGSEGLTALQELILDGDINTAIYQIKRLVDMDEEEEAEGEESSNKNENNKNDEPEVVPVQQRERSILHYAALTGQVDMCRRLLEDTPFKTTINDGDLVTGFSPLHIASFVQNPSLVYLFLTHGAKIDVIDNFGATPIDYLKLLDRIPANKPKTQESAPLRFNILPAPSASVLTPSLQFGVTLEQLEEATTAWSASKLQGKTVVTPISPSKPFQWISHYRINDEYVEELMFAGYEAPDQKDLAFRQKYFPLLEADAGLENLVVAYIDDRVGFGVYAAKPFKAGEFITSYYGEFVAKKRQKFRDYSMACSVDAIVLDASYYRSMGSFINHSNQPNAEAQGVFDKGIDRIVILATRPIPVGQQICIDYGAAYFKRKQKKGNSPRSNPAQAEFLDLNAFRSLSDSAVQELQSRLQPK